MRGWVIALSTMARSTVGARLDHLARELVGVDDRDTVRTEARRDRGFAGGDASRESEEVHADAWPYTLRARPMRVSSGSRGETQKPDLLGATSDFLADEC